MSHEHGLMRVVRVNVPSLYACVTLMLEQSIVLQVDSTKA
jgi:hypothetical protein